MKKSFIKTLLLILGFCLSVHGKSDRVMIGNDPSTWYAVDGLGRTLPIHSETGDKRQEKYVGLFYWTWHYSDNKGINNIPRNITTVLSEAGDNAAEAINDFLSPIWERTPAMTPYFWGEPVFNYYSNQDEYVLRKHAELIADAGVDVIFFDCTNGNSLYQANYRKLLTVFKQAVDDGVNVPKIAFMLNFSSAEYTLEKLKTLYAEYTKDTYKYLWFYWEGKPLIMAQKGCLNTADPLENEILNFFTFRYNVASYFAEDTTIEEEKWGWCSVYPQTLYGKRPDGSIEEICVSVAQNASKHGLVAMNDYRGGVFGRGYADGDYSYKIKNKVINKDTENAYYYGLNFQQQWDYAIEKDPDFIFVTGWNEWIALRHEEWKGTENAFPDQFNEEYSRDIEPENGVLKDHFYYQLVANIRKFKGVEPLKEANAYKTVDINGDFSQWDDITAEYAHYTGSTQKRSSKGWVGEFYESEGVRNDVVTSKVAYDEKNIYFYVETAEALSPHTDPFWMRLLIDTGDHPLSWEGFEYIINRTNPDSLRACLEKSMGDWNWEAVCEVPYRVSGKSMQIAVPRSALGFDTSAPSFSFKWADNNHDGDIMDFYRLGEAAPGGRFTYVFNTGNDKSVGTPFLKTLTAILGTLAVLAVGALIIYTLLKNKFGRN